MYFNKVSIYLILKALRRKLVNSPFIIIIVTVMKLRCMTLFLSPDIRVLKQVFHFHIKPIKDSEKLTAFLVPLAGNSWSESMLVLRKFVS